MHYELVFSVGAQHQLSDTQIDALLARCERRRRLWQGVRALEACASFAWPGLVGALMVLAVWRASGWDGGFVPSAGLAAAWLALSVWRTALLRDRLQVPGYLLPA